MINKDYIKSIFYNADGSLNGMAFSSTYLKKIGIYEELKNYFEDTTNLFEIVDRIITNRPHEHYTFKCIDIDCSKFIDISTYNGDDLEQIKEFNSNFIKTNFFTDFGTTIPCRMSEKYSRKIGLYEKLEHYYSDSDSISETIYRIANKIDIRPVDIVDGSRVPFVKIPYWHFSQFSCKANQNTCEEMLKKNSEGVSKSLKKKYDECGDDIKKKRNETLKERYGVETTSPFGVKEISDKARNTVLNNHNGEFPKRDDVQETSWRLSIQLQKERGLDISYSKDENNQVYVTIHNCCPIHGDVTMTKEQFNRRCNYSRPRAYKDLCIHCLPDNNQRISYTAIEREVIDILDEVGIKDYEMNNREILGGKEIDIYIDSLKLAIECQGCLWHSGKKSMRKHIYKRDLCASKGIKFFMLWDDEIIKHRDDVVNFFKNYLNGIVPERSDLGGDGEHLSFFINSSNYQRTYTKTANNSYECFHIETSSNEPIKIDDVPDEDDMDDNIKLLFRGKSLRKL